MACEVSGRIVGAVCVLQSEPTLLRCFLSTRSCCLYPTDAAKGAIGSSLYYAPLPLNPLALLNASWRLLTAEVATRCFSGLALWPGIFVSMNFMRNS